MAGKKQSARKKGGTSQYEADPAAVQAATGTSSPELQVRLVNQALAVLRGPDSPEEAELAIKATLDALSGINPRDELEGMLAAQMVAVHGSAMDCLRRAAIPEQTVVGRDLNLKHAVKLLQIYARQLEALDKHRGKGQQKITVEHVTVEAGGQAIVGNIETKASGTQPKPSTASAALTDERASASLNASRLDPARDKIGRQRPGPLADD